MTTCHPSFISSMRFQVLLECEDPPQNCVMSKYIHLVQLRTIIILGLYDGDIMSSDEVFTWLTTRVTEDHIQLVSDTILEDLVEKVPYVACLFTGTK